MIGQDQINISQNVYFRLSSLTVKENDTTYLILFSAARSHSSLASDVSSSSLVITISISCVRINALHCKMTFYINQQQSCKRSNLIQQRLAICLYIFCHLSLYSQGRVLYKKLKLLETDKSLDGWCLSFKKNDSLVAQSKNKSPRAIQFLQEF